MFEDIENKFGVPSITRGDVWYVDLGHDNVKGSEQNGKRPCVIIQNNTGNYYSTTVIVALITTKDKNSLPTHVSLSLNKKSTVMCEQIRTVAKHRLLDYIGRLKNDKLNEVNNALKVSLSLFK